jgi:hypothetical protein
MARRLAAIFPDFTLETFPERHHFDPPHRVEPDRLGASLLALWQRAESSRARPGDGDIDGELASRRRSR